MKTEKSSIPENIIPIPIFPEIKIDRQINVKYKDFIMETLLRLFHDGKYYLVKMRCVSRDNFDYDEEKQEDRCIAMIMRHIYHALIYQNEIDPDLIVSGVKAYVLDPNQESEVERLKKLQ